MRGALRWPRRRRRRAQALERQLAQARGCAGPWVIAAVAALTFGVAGSTALYAEARHQRDTAVRQSRIAEQINLFLANDLLARSNPFNTGKADETLVSAVTKAAPQIDRRFPTEPNVAAQLHQTIARALDRRDNWDQARTEYQRAAELWRQAEGAASVHAHMTGLQQAMMEARIYKAGSLQVAKALLAREEPAVAAIKDSGPELPVWLASARGMIALVDNQAVEAAKQFDLASKGADADQADFDLGQRLTFLQRLAFAHIRLGDGAQAETLFRKLAAGYAALEGPESGNVLMVRLNLAQALMVQGKYADSVGEADAVYPKMLAALGPLHELTLQVLSTRAQSEGALERWDAAIADTQLVHAAARQERRGQLVLRHRLADRRRHRPVPGRAAGRWFARHRPGQSAGAWRIRRFGAGECRRLHLGRVPDPGPPLRRGRKAPGWDQARGGGAAGRRSGLGRGVGCGQGRDRALARRQDRRSPTVGRGRQGHGQAHRRTVRTPALQPAKGGSRANYGD